MRQVLKYNRPKNEDDARALDDIKSFLQPIPFGGSDQVLVNEKMLDNFLFTFFNMLKRSFDESMSKTKKD